MICVVPRLLATNVTHYVNLGKDYVHRVGRTARAGRAGRSIAMVTQYDIEVCVHTSNTHERVCIGGVYIYM